MTTWISRGDAAEVAAALAATSPGPPLAGQRLAVKDNIDVAGFPTTAGCPSYAYAPAADAPVVARLRGGGAVVVGKTNLDQFATGLVGTRSPYGACESPIAPGRVSGGSSSGSAVAVATGEADLGLGTDTAGSGRVPAAFCGIVGLKPTPGWLSTTGVVPACRSFDCVSVFAREVAAAAAAVVVAAGFDADDPFARARGRSPIGLVERVGVPAPELVAASCDEPTAAAFAALVAKLPGLGFEVAVVDLAPYLAAGDLLYGGALVAERAAAVGGFVATHRDEVDPVVGAIIDAAAALPATALAADQARLAGHRRRADRTWASVDAVLVPTAPFHPTLAEVAAEPFAINARLGRFTNGCNLVGWCAAAVPAGETATGLPFGVTLLGAPWSDLAVWAAAARIAGHEAPAVPGGATDERLRLAVCGAHLAGEPLNHQLTDRGARLVARTTTASSYRMVGLPTDPPKPGLHRVASGGAALEVEVWSLAGAEFGSFVDDVPPPLVIGTVELADGSLVKGFLCEGHALDGAVDITAHGGWRAWRASQA